MRRIAPSLSIKLTLTAVLLVGIGISTLGGARAEGPLGEEAPAYLPTEVVLDQIVVKFKPSVYPIIGQELPTGIPSIDALITKFEVNQLKKQFKGAKPPREPARVDLSGFYKIKFPPTFNPQEVAAEFSQDPNVEHAQVIGIHPVYPEEQLIPNDFLFPDQWALNNTGQTEGTLDADVDAPEAWKFYHGSSSVALAIVDTGVDWQHPDLGGTAANDYTDGNIWINLAEYNGTAGVDDDGNGYIDDIRGWDWVDGVDAWSGEDGDTPDNDPMDFNGHGTHCAGIASAITDNGVGVAGLAWDAKIMALRAGWSGKYRGQEVGYVRMDFAAEAIYYATDVGVTAVNCSWGSSDSGGLGAAVDYAIEKGVLVVVAAGNENTDSPSDYLWTRGDCIDVAATDHNDQKAMWDTQGSNYGSWVDVSAPGDNILSAYFDHEAADPHTYATASGTSMAAPHVVGLIGLVKGYYPGLTASEIKPIIYNSADDIDALNPGYGGLLGSGRINAYNTLSSTPIERRIAYKSHTVDDTAYGNGDLKADPGETSIEMTVTLINNGSQDATEVSANLTTTDSYVTITSGSSTYPDLAKRGGSGDSETPYIFDVDPSCPQGWEVSFQLNISANGGAYTTTDTFTIIVGTPPTQPDLTLTGSTDIVFSNPSPAVDEEITITATIHNNGADYNDIDADAFAEVTSGGTSGYYVDITQWDAQSFTATSDGYLAKVAIAAWDCNNNVTDPAQFFKVSIQGDDAGKPDGTDLSSIESYDFGTSTEWHDFIFSTPARLANGTKYWVVARSTAPDTDGYAWRYAGPVDAYAGGGANVEDTTDESIIWGTESTNEDFWFGVYMYTYNTVVKFYDGDPDAAGTQISTDQILPPIAYYGTDTASANWTATYGSHDIYVAIDYPSPGSIDESIENNNKDYKPITVGIAISITVTDGAVAFGVIALGEAKDTTATGLNDVQIVTVETGPVNLNIRTSVFSDGTHTWALGSTNGDDEVKWEFSPTGTGWTIFEVADVLYPLASNLGTGATQEFYFCLTMPTYSSSTSEYSATVTIVAVAP